MIVALAKMAEPIEMQFGMWTRVGPRHHILEEVQIPTHEGAILRANMGPKVDRKNGRDN